MNCNCNMINNAPKIPSGNDFKIAVALKEYIKQDGDVSERDINIGSITGVAVIKSTGESISSGTAYTYTLNGSVVVLSFDNQEGESGLGKGKYGIEVKGKRSEDNSDFRFYMPPGYGFAIVESTMQGYFPSDSIITYTVSGVVGVAQNVSGGGGGSATVGTLNTTNETAQTPSASESFGGAINLHKVSKTGSYNDLRDKPTIPSISGLASQEWVNQQGFLTAHQDISGKEDIITIATALGNNSTAEFGKYYLLTITTTTTINLPAITGSETHLKGFLIYLTVESGGSVDFSSNNNETIMESGLSDIEESKTYEVNAVWNGAVWAITAIELTAYSTT